MQNSFSPLRQNILNYIEKSSAPLSAAEIFSGIKFKNKTAFSSVYRALWFLEEKGFIFGFSVPCESCGKDRFFTDASRGHIHYFHCGKCHQFIEIADCSIDTSRIEKKFKIQIQHHSVFYSGLCSSCGRK